MIIFKREKDCIEMAIYREDSKEHWKNLWEGPQDYQVQKYA
jgi:hypothetical protein